LICERSIREVVDWIREFYVRNRTGDLMSRATNGFGTRLRMVLGTGIMYQRNDRRDDGAGDFFHVFAFRRA